MYIDDFKESKLSTGNRPSDNTVATVVFYITKIIRFAKSDFGLLMDLEEVTIPRKQQKEKEYFTNDELDKICAAADMNNIKQFGIILCLWKT